jgi:hypothetical protein
VQVPQSWPLQPPPRVLPGAVMDAPTRLALFLLVLCIYLMTLAGDVSGAELPVALKVVACESAGRHWGGAFRLNCNTHEPTGGQSCGIAQFQVASFAWMKHKADMPELRYWEPRDQLTLLNWAVEHGYARYWSCYRKVRRGWKVTPAMRRKIRKNTYLIDMYGAYL